MVFVDETSSYLLPLVVKTYAPKGRTPVLRAPLSRDHLSVISSVIAHGWLHTRVQDRPCRGKDAARFLKHPTTHISVRLLVIWDGNPIHRCQEVKALLASPAGQGVHSEASGVEECHLSASRPAILRARQGHQAAQAKASHHSCLHGSGRLRNGSA
jgi:DDE superfamily endonuclease